jgi:hypothetical protein
MFNQTIFQMLSNLPLRPRATRDFALKHPFSNIHVILFYFVHFVYFAGKSGFKPFP